jgi:type I restriction enzyme S subunit
MAKVLAWTNPILNKGVEFDNVVTRNISTKIIERKKLQKGEILSKKSGGSPTQPVGRVAYRRRILCVIISILYIKTSKNR